VLDEYLDRSDVKSFIKELKTNERYYEKINNVNVLNLYKSSEMALFIFYDALLKYKTIINDIYLFDEYIEQLEKLYRKLDNFEDIRFGINKLICKIIIIKFDIKNINDIDSRNTIIDYIYKKYIKEGYFVHGFSSAYVDKIKEDGFVPEKYENLYDRFIEINKIFAKNNVINIINKDFDENRVFFTDDFVLGCYYSAYSPLYYSKFLMNEEYFGKIKRKDSYLKDSYSTLISYLKRFMSNNLFSENDRKIILDLVKDEWDLLHRKDKRISLLLVKRKLISDKEVSVDKFIEDDSDLYEVVDRLLNSKNNSISYSKSISKDDLEIVELDNYYEKEEIVEDNEDEYKNIKEEISKDFFNKYGSVSYLLLLGSLFITLGVIFTIIKVIGG